MVTTWVVRAAIAHFWFVCIFPFEDGNGRLARILVEGLRVQIQAVLEMFLILVRNYICVH